MQAIHSEFVTDNKQKVVILNTHTKAHYKNLLLEENQRHSKLTWLRDFGQIKQSILNQSFKKN